MGRYQSWLTTLVETRKTATTLGQWVVTSAVVFSILTLAAFVPPFRGWFQLEFWPAALCFLPMMLLGLLAGAAESRGRLDLQAFGFLILLGAGLFQFFWAALVVMSQPPGSFVMAAFVLLTVTMHGYLHRVTAQYPYGLLPTAAAMTGAFLLRPSSPSLPLLYFIAPTGMLLSLITGGVGLRMHENLVQSDKLKQALYYRALNEKSREHAEMSRRVLDLLRYSHDAGNTLSAIFVHAQLLEDKIASNAAVPELARISAPISTLLNHLDRLKVLLSRAHRIADEMPVVETVPVFDIVHSVGLEHSALFPKVSLQVLAAESARRGTVKVHEGEIGLRRLLENVVRNSCEGNGVRGATQVIVQLTITPEHISFEVRDNGPGFSGEQLAAPPIALSTTKQNGHGLGLYGVNELVLASGGTLQRANHTSGGALVTVVLPRGPDSILDAAPAGEEHEEFADLGGPEIPLARASDA